MPGFLRHGEKKWLPFACLLAWMACGAFMAYSQTGPPLQRLSARVNGHTFAVWARIPPSPRSVVLLLHGRTWSSLPAFDLQVPGLRRSALLSLAAKGIAAYALDQRGYGETPRDATGWITPLQAAKDADAILGWVAARHPLLPKPALLGWSLGAATAHLVAASSPADLSAVILYGYAPDPKAVIVAGVAPLEPLRSANTREAAAGDFLSPAVTDPAVVKAFVSTAIRTDPVHVDWKNEADFLCDSSRIKVPTLVLYGDRDPNVEAASLESFFGLLAAKGKQAVKLRGADHCAHLETTHDDWIAAIADFLARLPPPRRGSVRSGAISRSAVGARIRNSSGPDAEAPGKPRRPLPPNLRGQL